MRGIVFQKSALSTAEHLDLLLDRSMVIPDLDDAGSSLRGIGYYRLSVY